MKLKMYTVHDSKAEAYLNPFTMRSKGEAIRAFSNTVNSPESQFNMHPGDYTLFEIGEYDEETGTLIPHQSKISLGCAIEHKKSPDLAILSQQN